MNKCMFCDKEANYTHFARACWKHHKTKKFKELNKRLWDANKILYLSINNIKKEYKKLEKLIIKGYTK